MKVTLSNLYLSGFELPKVVTGPVQVMTRVPKATLPAATTLVTSMEKEVFDKALPVLQQVTTPLLRVSAPLIAATKIAVPQVLKMVTKPVGTPAPQTIQQFKESDEIEKKSALEEAMSLIPLGGLAMFAFIL